MTRKRKRLVMLLAAMAALGVAATLTVNALWDNMTFSLSPSEAEAKGILPDQRFRLLGLVEPASVSKLPDGATRFIVTDLKKTMPVTYRGVLPDLFREGQGVITEGALNRDGVFVAREVLARHDENYMPPDVAKKLKASGEWRPPGSTVPGSHSLVPQATAPKP